jgi:hypothetical protein
MNYYTRLICGLLLLTVPSIQFGGYFLLNVISGYEAELGLTKFQEAMFRAGHAHAGVLVILALVAVYLSDYARLSNSLMWVVRIGFPLAAILISGGFFAAAIGSGITEPTGLIVILYAGVIILAVSLVTLGVGLVRKFPEK